MLKYASHLIWATALIASPLEITDVSSDRGRSAEQGGALAQQSDVDVASLQRDLAKLRNMQETENRRAAEIAAKRKAEEQPLLKAWLEIERKTKKVNEVLADAKPDVKAKLSAKAEAALNSERQRILNAWAELRRKIAQEKHDAEIAAAERKAQVEHILAALRRARRKNGSTEEEASAGGFTFAVPKPVQVPDSGPQEQNDSLIRARKLIEDGRVNEGRLFLEHAADAGSAEAAFELAESYDPFALRRQGAIGVVPNRSMAAKWYRRAGELGAKGTQERMNRLGR